MIHYCSECGAFSHHDSTTGEAVHWALVCPKCGHVEAQNPHPPEIADDDHVARRRSAVPMPGPAEQTAARKADARKAAVSKRAPAKKAAAKKAAAKKAAPSRTKDDEAPVEIEARTKDDGVGD